MWKPPELEQTILQTDTQGQSQHFEFSTTVTSTVNETETGPRTFSASDTENTIPPEMTAEVQCGVYHVQPGGGGEFMQSLEEKVGYSIEESRTLTDECSLTLDVPANSRLTVFLGPEGDQRSGNYGYYVDDDVNGAAEGEEEGTYDAVKVRSVYLDYAVSELLP